MTDHASNCYRNQTMGHYGGGPADCDCGAARRPSVKSASMTDAADKAAADVINLFADGVHMRSMELDEGAIEGLETAILSAIESAAQAERERAGKLLEALEFYANPEAYKETDNSHWTDYGLEHDSNPPDVWQDQGEEARNAISAHTGKAYEVQL